MALGDGDAEHHYDDRDKHRERRSLRPGAPCGRPQVGRTEDQAEFRSHGIRRSSGCSMTKLAMQASVAEWLSRAIAGSPNFGRSMHKREISLR
ncbi:hypothetical protein [Bradyrhizobium guangdongense]|uniref:hypothetical protein n=1 Tax=Bradyrhizobium guangdongense TaxID=1325090 RepID=UPI001319DCFB|nr:hypothetical protein [Bradyrhizobium guangdongense]